MNRQKIIDGYSCALQTPRRLSELIQKHSDIFTECRLEPICYAETPETHSVASTTMSAELTSAVSFASNMSRVDMERVLLREILKNRREHPVFTELDKLSGGSSLWYFLEDKSQRIQGPLDSAAMDGFFFDELLNENSKLKKKEEEDYYSLFVLLRRYFKRHLEERLQLAKNKARLPKKVAIFRKGCKLSKKTAELEEIELRGRNYRVLSSASKPLNIQHLLVHADDDEDEDPAQTRGRAKTLAA